MAYGFEYEKFYILPNVDLAHVLETKASLLVYPMVNKPIRAPSAICNEK